MLLRDDQTINTQQLISSLYSNILTSTLLMELSPLICKIVDSHYFALILFPGEYIPEPIYISNNPDDFNSIYQEIQDKDFMLHAMMENIQPVHFNHLVRKDIPYKREFLTDLNKARPVSDCCYIPIKLDGRLSGFIGIAREGLKNLHYNNNELEIIKYIGFFISEGVERSLILPELQDNTAYLNKKGEVLKIGDRIKDLFIELFGIKWDQPLWSETEFSAQFTKSWSSFLSPIKSPGDGSLFINTESKQYNLEYCYYTVPFLKNIIDDEPYIKITLKKTNLVFTSRNPDYNFTPREEEVIDCIYRGLTNNEISQKLRISVSTTKKHLWNVYNKVGVDSRTSLLFSLSH